MLEDEFLGCNSAWQGTFSRRNFLNQLAEASSRLEFRDQLRYFLGGGGSECRSELFWSERLRFQVSVRMMHEQPQRFLIRLQDISRSHQRLSLQCRLEQMVEHLPDPVFLLDPHSGQTVYANAATLRALQASRKEELQTSNYGPLLESEGLEKLAQRLSYSGAVKMESTPRTATGRRFPAELSLQLVHSEARTWIAGMLRDNSERKRELSALQTTGSRLQAILAAAPVAIVTFTLEGLVALWSPGAEQIYGWAAEEVLLKVSPFPDYFSSGSVAKVIETGSTIRLQMARQCKRGHSIHLSLSLCPLRNQTGQLVGLLEVAEDITDRVNEDLLRSNRRMLESREEERLSLAREIHDGPMQELVAVGFSLANLRFQLKASAGCDIQQTQEAVMQVVRHLRAVITKLRPAGLEELGLLVSLEGLVVRLGLEAASPPVTRLHLEPIVDLRPSQELCLFRIVQEAYQNCLRHGQASVVSISLRAVNSQAELTVEDNGRGFTAPARLSDLAANEHYGLVGMQERALLANGEFQLESQPGLGTRIRVTIPLEAFPEVVVEAALGDGKS